jgi:hypothetical protein
MVGRRDFVKAGAAMAAVAGLPSRAGADVPVHLFQGHDFGPGPKVADRLNQGPFGIDQDEGWYTIETTTASAEPTRNFGMGLVGYTFEENGPSLAVREGKESLEAAVERLATLPFVDLLYIRCDWRDVQSRPGRLDFHPVWALTLDAAKRHGLLLKLHADELGDAGGAGLAAEVGALSADHLLRASPEGRRAMAAAGVVGVLLPGTAFTLGLPYADARGMIADGLAVAVATDWNPGSTMSSSLPLAMTMAVTQMRMTPAEAWMAVTANAASAIGRGERIGRIQPGYGADLTLFEASDHRHVAYHYGHDHVRLVVAGGAVAHVRESASGCT